LKILVCTDGSNQSQKVLEKASVLANGNIVDEVIIIYVYDGSFVPGSEDPSSLSEDFKKWQEKSKKKGEKILSEAKSFIEHKLDSSKAEEVNIRTIYEKGHPSSKIINTAYNEEVDMIFIGNRGMSGFKKILLGSVSNAVVQEATNCSVTVVK